VKRGLYASGSLIAGLLLCVALMAYLGVGKQDGLRVLRGLSWPWSVLLVAIIGFLWWSGAYKWAIWAKALHGEAGDEPSPGFFQRHYAWQNWVGQFVPPSLAIILGRSWATRRVQGVGWKAGAGSGLYDQLMEFAFMEALLPAAALILLMHVGAVFWVPACLIGMAGVGGILFLVCSRLAPKLRPYLVPLLVWSAARTAFTVISIVVGAPVLGLNIAPAFIVAASPIVALLVLIPLTPGNLGLAEWGWAGVLAFAGTNALDAGLLALGFRLLMLAVQSALLVGWHVAFSIRHSGRKMII